jgi:cobalt-precorrin-5B (C1)-methyltransferase
MDDYVVVNGKRFRKGYTTGACAAGAAKASVLMLVSGRLAESVEIDTPAGVRLVLPVTDASVTPGGAVCAIVKDGGDDPDVTTGLRIFAEAAWKDGAGIEVGAGEGIGTVTLPGLKVEPGKPAINPAPMQMILKEVGEVLPEGKGVSIRLSVPGGKEAALRTYNPRLGITGGISIIGTTGIVTPMSEEAWKEALALELKVMWGKGVRLAVFVFGNYGESFAEERLRLQESSIIKVSNFVGYMLDRAAELGMEKLLLVGHMGKLVKVAAGIFHTHSRVADARMEILAAYAALEGASREVVSALYGCATTEAAIGIIKKHGLTSIFSRIVENTSKKCMDYCYGKIKIGSVLFHEEGSLLAMDQNAAGLIMEAGGSYGGQA